MISLRIALTVLALLLLATTADAFSPCDDIYTSRSELLDDLRTAVIKRTPVKYRAAMEDITVEATTDHDSFMPIAVEDTASGQGISKRILVTPVFAKTMCEISLATFLVLENRGEGDFKASSVAAAKCLDAGNSLRLCLREFGADLARRYDVRFRKLPKSRQEAALSLFWEAFHGLFMHEYGHHFLDHFARIASKELERVDAEFEADLFAIMTGVQIGSVPTGLVYFFKGLAEIERSTSRFVTKEYESAQCRVRNIGAIAIFLSHDVLSLLWDLIREEDNEKTKSYGVVRSKLRKLSGEPPPSQLRDVCAKMAKQDLPGMHQELRNLFLRVGKEAEVLYAKNRPLKPAALKALVRDLTEMSDSFRILNGLAALSASNILRRQNLLHQQARTNGKVVLNDNVSVEPLVDPSVSSNLLSGHAGMLMMVSGLSLLHEDTLPLEIRLERAERDFRKAVYFNPLLAEAWANLGLIAFKRGKCSEAAIAMRQAQKTVTLSRDQKRETVDKFTSRMERLSKDESRCRSESRDFSFP